MDSGPALEGESVETQSTGSTNTNAPYLPAEEVPDTAQRLTMESMRTANPTPNVPVATTRNKVELSVLGDVPLTLVFEVGQTSITIAQLMKLCRGSFISLKHAAVDSIEVKVTGQVIAKAETITMGNHYGIRISEIEIPLSLMPENN